MPSVLFSNDEVARFFDEDVPLSVTELETEARRRALPGKLEDVILPGVFYGGADILAGWLVGIQPGLVLFVAGNGDSDSSMGSHFDLRFCTGIVRRRTPGEVLKIERFSSSMIAVRAIMRRAPVRPHPPHLEGLAGYLHSGLGWDPDDSPYIGFREEVWKQITDLLDRYLLDPVT